MSDTLKFMPDENNSFDLDLIKLDKAFLKEMLSSDNITYRGLSSEEKLDIIAKVNEFLNEFYLETQNTKNLNHNYNSHIDSNFNCSKSNTECCYMERSFSILHKKASNTAHILNSSLMTKYTHTIKHHRSVSHIARKIAAEAKMSDKSIKIIEVAALLHDIGKIFVPSKILDKKDSLSNTEYSIIKTHVKNSFNLLKAAKIPLQIPEIVSQHHERLNGSGYPNGLKGNEILPEAYVIIIADVFDALTSDRPYRKKYTYKKAFDIILRESKDFYDKKITEAFVNSINSAAF